jgi:hypothetical protein
MVSLAALTERVAGLERSRDAYAHQLAGIAEELDAGRRRHAETKDEHAARLAALEADRDAHAECLREVATSAHPPDAARDLFSIEAQARLLARLAAKGGGR